MADRRLIDDCFVHDRDRLTHAEALAILRERLGPVAGTETVPLAEACGRILAEDVSSPFAVPRSDNAAVDGYAFRHADHAAAGGFFPVVQRIAAGHPPAAPLAAGAAARIFTGAWMPDGADTVAMQEDCEPHEQDGRDFVVIPGDLKAGANRRRAGEDLAAGDAIARAGTILRPQEIAALASVGTIAVTVRKRLRVALFSSGDEVARAGETLPPGGLYDANFPLLSALIALAGATVTDGGVLPDDEALTHRALKQAAADHDAIISSGGASRGAEDHLVHALEALGKRHLWQIAVKPGRPMNFGQIGDCAVFGLPGNPVAAFVCFLLYARQALHAMCGAKWREPRRYPLPAAFEIAKKKADRREFLRGFIVERDGRTMVDRFPRDGSGLITGLRQAEGLIEIPEPVTAVKPGDTVAFLPFAEFGIVG